MTPIGLVWWVRVQVASAGHGSGWPKFTVAVVSCRSGGVVSMIGVYGGLPDKFPAGAWMIRSLTLRTEQCHVQRYMKPLLQRIERGEIDPTRIITHPLPLNEAERGFDMFKNNRDNCEKVVLKP